MLTLPQSVQIWKNNKLLGDPERDISPVNDMVIIGSTKISNIFLLPSEIEDIVIWEKQIFTIEEFRKLRFFRFYMEESGIVLTEDLWMIEKQAKQYKDIPIRQILQEFTSSTDLIWRNNPTLYRVYFTILEDYYEQETGEPLSFKWMDVAIWYDENLGF